MQLCPSGMAYCLFLFSLDQFRHFLSRSSAKFATGGNPHSHPCLVKVRLPPAASISCLPVSPLCTCWLCDPGHGVQPLCASVLICKQGDWYQLLTIMDVLPVECDNTSKRLARCSINVSYYWVELFRIAIFLSQKSLHLGSFIWLN